MTLPGAKILPALLWLIISTVLLTLPGSSLPKEDWLDKLWLDKWVHIFLFGLLTWFWCRWSTRFSATPEKRKRTFLIIALACLGYGVAMEFVQHYLVVNRSYDLGDIVADAAGCGVGYYISWYRYIKK